MCCLPDIFGSPCVSTSDQRESAIRNRSCVRVGFPSVWPVTGGSTLPPVWSSGPGGASRFHRVRQLYFLFWRLSRSLRRESRLFESFSGGTAQIQFWQPCGPTRFCSPPELCCWRSAFRFICSWAPPEACGARNSCRVLAVASYG